MKVFDLGWCMARLNTTANILTIVSPADYSDGNNVPAESIVISGKSCLEALRDALNEAYPATYHQGT